MSTLAEQIRILSNRLKHLEEGIRDPIVNVYYDNPQRPTIDVPANMLYGNGANIIKEYGLPMPREGQKIPLVADTQSIRSNLKGYDEKNIPGIKPSGMGTSLPPLMFPFQIDQPYITGEVAWPAGVALVQPNALNQLIHPPK
jgi:hypothetical protein